MSAEQELLVSTLSAIEKLLDAFDRVAGQKPESVAEFDEHRRLDEPVTVRERPERTVKDAMNDSFAHGETRPAPAHRATEFHWLVSERATGPCVAVWDGGSWYLINEAGPISPAQIWQRGWAWYWPIEIPPILGGER